MKILAVDVSSITLLSYEGSRHWSSPNSPAQIQELLEGHPDHVVVCEPTSTYHLALVEAAIGLGREVYLVNPKEARNYKDSLSFRAKTDPLDARYLYEYVSRNRDLLRPYKPPPAELAELKRLLGERHLLVESRTSLTQCFRAHCSKAHEDVLTALDTLIVSLEKEMLKIAKRYPSYTLLRSIPGVGVMSGCALLYVLESHCFDSADALVAFLGLDVRIRQSGKFRGRQKITKRGDALLRFLLCFAGRGLLNSKFGQKKKTELQAKKRHFPERLIIAARKILRTAYFLFHQKIEFDPGKWTWPIAMKA